MRLDDHVTADLRRGSCSAEKFWVFDVKWEPPTLIALLGQSKHKFSPPSKPRWIHSGADKTSSQVGAEKVCFCSSTEVRSGGDGVGGQIVRDEETGVGLYIIMNEWYNLCVYTHHHITTQDPSNQRRASDFYNIIRISYHLNSALNHICTLSKNFTFTKI